MPELPEVEALARDLTKRLDGRAIVRVDIATFSCLKTYDPPVTALAGGLRPGRAPPPDSTRPAMTHVEIAR